MHMVMYLFLFLTFLSINRLIVAALAPFRLSALVCTVVALSFSVAIGG